MTETNESQENQNEEEAAVPTMTTVERAEMLLQQDAAIRAKINGGAALDEAVDPSNKEFGPLAHPEQVQMRVAKRAMMLKEGIQPYPVTLDVTATIEEVRAKYDGKLEAGDETEDVVGIAGRVLFLRNAGGLCFVQLSAGDGTKIQGMISKKEIGADSLKQFKQLVDLGDHLFIKGRVIASKTGELSVFATEWAIAAKVRLTGDREPHAIDARTLPQDINELARVLENVDVIGRVLPDQKKAIVQALHTSDHVVAMTGDGVNDSLAIKEADLGIAMGNAAPATKAVAQVVLVDSKFSHLPDVVARGRQVMANMERVASLFLVKTVYSALISLGVVLTAIPFPYLPRHITYVGALTIGMPAFILALAPNTRRYIPGFLRRVVYFALPGGVAIALSVLLSSWLLPDVMGWDVNNAADLSALRTTCAIIVFVLGVFMLARVAQPLNSWRGVLVAVFAAAGVIGMFIPFVARFFDLHLPTGRVLIAMVAALLISTVLFVVCHVILASVTRIFPHIKPTRQS